MSDTQRVPARFGDALHRLDGDVELLREMAKITSEDLPEVVAQVESAIAAEDVESTVRNLHKLKGMLSTFEAEGVTLQIQEMLDAARKSRMREVTQSYGQQKYGVHELIKQVAVLAGG